MTSKKDEKIKDKNTRVYQVTINNPLQKNLSHERIKEILSKSKTEYYCMADEIAPETGTYHTHLFVMFSNPLRLKTLSKRMGNCHCEAIDTKIKGIIQSNIDYIQKSNAYADKKSCQVEGTFEEVGNRPVLKEKKIKQPLMSIVLEDIKNGKSVTDIIEENPSLAFKIKQLSELRQKYLAKQYLGKTRNVNVIYKYGATGTGKSKSTLEEFPDAYRITNYRLGRGGVYFDGYDGNSAIVFEEFSSNKIPIVEMLNYLDIYYIMLPCRYFDVVRNISELW